MPGVEPGGQRRTAALGSRAACNGLFLPPRRDSACGDFATQNFDFGLTAFAQNDTAGVTPLNNHLQSTAVARALTITKSRLRKFLKRGLGKNFFQEVPPGKRKPWNKKEQKAA